MLENGGSGTSCEMDSGPSVICYFLAHSALAAAVTCASVALSETGVEMLDVPVACSVVRMYVVWRGHVIRSGRPWSDQSCVNKRSMFKFVVLNFAE